MSESLAPRGPDQSGAYYHHGCALLHRRLVVVDPAGGRQPMTYKNLTIVYNGELYNTPELRTELQQLGYQFDGHGDTEVVLKSFHAWGEDCAKKFNGIFAYAVYNETTHQLFFARGPHGGQAAVLRSAGQHLPVCLRTQGASVPSAGTA